MVGWFVLKHPTLVYFTKVTLVTVWKRGGQRFRLQTRDPEGGRGVRRGREKQTGSRGI